MFGIFRRAILLLLVAAASIVFWEASGFRSALPPAGQEIPSAKNSESIRNSEPSAQQPEALIPGTPGQRFLAWALFVLLLPIVAASVTNRVLQKESNTATLVLLFGYTGLDVLAAWLVGGIQIAGLWSGIGYLIALLAVFTYNLWVCSLLAKLHE